MNPERTDCLAKCPRCGRTYESGFCSGNVGLSFVEPAKLKNFMFAGEDIAMARWRKLIPAKARYYRSYLCRACHLYLVDHSRLFTHNEAKELARVMTHTRTS